MDKTKSGFTTPIKNINDLGAALDKLKPAMFAVAATAGAAFLALSKSAINSADDMGKLAQKAGTTVETFSGMAYAAAQNDLEQEKLAKAFKETAKAITEAETAGSPMQQLFESMGISTRDMNGNLLASDAVLLQISDRFADTADGAGKVATAAKIFGDKLGSDLIPFLNQGASGIRELVEEGKDLGQVFDGQTAAAAEQFNDNLAKLKAALQGVANVFIKELAPSLAAGSDAMVRWVRESGVVRGAAQTLIDVFKVLDYVARLVLTAFGALTDLFEGVGKAIGTLVSSIYSFFEGIGTAAGFAGAAIYEFLTGNFESARFIIEEGLGHVNAHFDAFGNGIKQIGNEAATAWENAMTRLSKGPLPPDLSAAVLDVDATAPAAGGDSRPEMPIPLDLEKIKANLRAVADFRAQMNIEALDGEARLIAAEVERHRQALERIETLKVAESEKIALTELAEQAHQVKLAKIHGDGIKKRLDMERAAHEQRKAMYNEALRAGSRMFGDLAAAAQAFGKKGFKAMKAFAIAQTIIDTYSGAQAAYTAMARIPYVGPVLGVAAAAAAVAAGMARVASIRSMEPAGVAHAGLSMVPEEATYILQRGERVLAPRQNEDLTEFLQGRGSAGNQNITLMIDGEVMGRIIGRLGRNGQLEIPERAIVTA